MCVQSCHCDRRKYRATGDMVTSGEYWGALSVGHRYNVDHVVTVRQMACPHITWMEISSAYPHLQIGPCFFFLAGCQNPLCFQWFLKVSEYWQGRFFSWPLPKVLVLQGF